MHSIYYTTQICAESAYSIGRTIIAAVVNGFGVSSSTNSGSINIKCVRRMSIDQHDRLVASLRIGLSMEITI